ncbi:MAG: BlaI/MecI/CopY family transcriptional regulator [Deltaproteobacteria bacterium]|nr:BlaI/MecI/CopY family transcriptional regulator [Deltaproteobacteria bacterium]
MTRPEVMPILGDLEEAVLEHLWSAGQADVLETHAKVGAPRHITVNTVGSALERLHRKGLVMRWKVSHAYHYRAAMDRDAYFARRLLEAGGGMRELQQRGVLTAFVDLIASQDSRALERLEEIVAARRGARSRKDSR